MKKIIILAASLVLFIIGSGLAHAADQTTGVSFIDFATINGTKYVYYGTGDGSIDGGYQKPLCLNVTVINEAGEQLTLNQLHNRFLFNMDFTNGCVSKITVTYGSDITSTPYTIVYRVSNTNVGSGATVTISATVSNGGVPTANKKVAFNIETGKGSDKVDLLGNSSVDGSSATTNDKGEVSFKYKFNQSGKYHPYITIHSRFGNTELANGTSPTVDVSIIPDFFLGIPVWAYFMLLVMAAALGFIAIRLRRKKKTLVSQPNIENKQIELSYNKLKPANADKNTSSLQIIGFVLAFFIPIAGLVVSIIGLIRINKLKTGNKALSVAGIIISIILLPIEILLVVSIIVAIVNPNSPFILGVYSLFFAILYGISSLQN